MKKTKKIKQVQKECFTFEHFRIEQATMLVWLKGTLVTSDLTSGHVKHLLIKAYYNL